ncbi:Aromatic/aminoadipate aminotransferase 1 [Fusarium solani]|uniref:aromatic-amino-acid transaminase n=1 Tax=Fusarium solani TaxID=169388 RepID=A0A9P9HD72_FUSSL|nr:pyridoxal phosphate-dependent transferase [Fusarium solani]KAH7254912.1 pyridoxal phosphate-dependent transferase [Fusarium solani]KAJ4213181.1 Aromatic/aminoadipate aminotransferase 1 [Fusarium solani]
MAPTTTTESSAKPELPVDIDNIKPRRKILDKSQWGPAAPAKSETFRIRDHTHKPKAKRWDHVLSKESAERMGNSLKYAAGFLGLPGMISLGGGLPSSEYFPWDELYFKVPSAGQFSEKDMHEHGVLLQAGKHAQAREQSEFDIATAFNYGQGHGSAQLLRWITEHTELVHDPPYSDWACTMTLGSTSSLDFAFRMLTQHGDYILSEEYTFSTAVESGAPMGIKVAGVKMDEEGLLPDSLDYILTNWDPEKRDGAQKPRVLYTVPTGQNPTGATQGVQRRKGVYAVAQKHDLYIIEDEPYYFLQMQPYAGRGAAALPPTTRKEFLDSLLPSYLSMDVDGRVMRLDSFSKVLAPGTRCGWITASEQMVDRYSRHSEVGTQGPSGVSQLMLFKLLDEHWGHGVYLDWLVHLRMGYTQRRDVILDACEKWLPKEVVSWKPPVAGMFHWLQVDWKKHPSASSRSITEIEHEIFMTSIEHRALVIKGSFFYANKAEEHDALFFRTTYAAAPSDKIHEAIRRFGDAVRESFGLEQ